MIGNQLSHASTAVNRLLFHTTFIALTYTLPVCLSWCRNSSRWSGKHRRPRAPIARPPSILGRWWHQCTGEPHIWHIITHSWRYVHTNL